MVSTVNMSLVSLLGDPVFADIITQPLLFDNPLKGLIDFLQEPPTVDYGEILNPFVDGALTTPTESDSGIGNSQSQPMDVAVEINKQLQNGGIALLSTYLAYFLVAWGAGLKQGSQAVREGAKIVGAVGVITISPTILWELLSVSSELAPAMATYLQTAFETGQQNAADGLGLGDLANFGQGLITTGFLFVGVLTLFVVLMLIDYLRMAFIVAGFSFMPLFIAAALFAGTVDSVGSFGRKGIKYTISAIFLPVTLTIALNIAIITYLTLGTLSPTGVIDGIVIFFLLLAAVWAGLKATAVGGKIGSAVKGAAVAGLAIAGGYAVGAGMIGSGGGSAAAGAARAGRTAGKLGMSKFGGRGGRAAANELFGQYQRGGTRDPTPNEEESDTGDGETSAATDYRTQDGAGGGGGRGGYSGGGSTQAASTEAQATQNMGQMVQDTRVQATPVRDAAMAPDDDSDKVAAAAEMKDATDSEVNFSSPVQPDPRDLNDQLDQDATNEVMQAWNIEDGLEDAERVNKLQNAADVSGKHLEYEDLNQKQQTALGDVGIEQQEYAERRLTNGDIETTYGTDKDSVRKDINKAHGSLDRAKQKAPEAVNTLTTVDATNKAQNMMGVGANTPDRSADEIFTEMTGVDPDTGSSGATSALDESAMDDYAREYDRIMGLGNYVDPEKPEADLLDPKDHPEAAKAYFTAMENTPAHSDDLTYTENGITDQYDTKGKFARMPGGHTTNARMAGHADNGASNMKAHTTMLEGAGLSLNTDEIQNLHGDPSSTILTTPDPSGSFPHPATIPQARQDDVSLVSQKDELSDAHDMMCADDNPHNDGIDSDARDAIGTARVASNAPSTDIGKNGGATGFDDIDEMIKQYSGMSSTLDQDDHDETPSGFFR